METHHFLTFVLLLVVTLINPIFTLSNNISSQMQDDELTFYLQDDGILNTTPKSCFSSSDPCHDFMQIINYIEENVKLNQFSLLSIFLIGKLTRCDYQLQNYQVLNTFRSIRMQSFDSNISKIECEVFFQFPTNFQFEMKNLKIQNSKIFMMERLQSVKISNSIIENGNVRISVLKNVILENCTFYNVIGMYFKSQSGKTVAQQVLFERSSVNFNSDAILIGNSFKKSKIEVMTLSGDSENNYFDYCQIVAKSNDVKMSNSRLFTSSFDILLVSYVKFDNFHFNNSNLLLSGIKNFQISNSKFMNNSKLQLTTVFSSTLTGLTFENNENSIHAERIGSLEMDNSKFSNNLNPIFISGNQLSNDFRRFDSCEFSNNFATENGLLKIENLHLSLKNCNFTNNWAGNGGIIYAVRSTITLMDSQLVGNSARIVERCRDEQCGNGGIAYLSNSVLFMINLFIRNVKAVRGGIVYTDGNSRIESENCDIADNYASMAGNLFYFGDLIDFKAENYSKSDLSSRRITRAVWRTDLSQSFHEGKISAQPGQTIHLDFDYFDVFDNKLNRTDSAPIISTNDSSETLVSLVSIDSYSNTDLKFFLQVKEGSKFSNISILLPFHNFEFEIGIDILECPFDYGLSPLLNSNYNVCVYRGYTIIICSSIGISIILLIIIYVIFHIGKRLLKLRKKELTEKEIAQKFMDKNFIFSVNNNNSENIPLLSKLRLDKVNNIVIPIEDIELIRRIGEGANGTVYLANWKGNRVALKSLKFESSDNEDFENESALLNNLRHPSIVRFYGIVVSSSVKYMVMEFVENGSLDKAIQNSKNGKRKLDLLTKIEILRGVANGMNYLHNLKNPCLHRDLKSQNILLNSNMEPKVTDFGLSKLTSNSMTMTCNIGTALYMAPELFGSGFKISHKLDVYSFSIVMYELFFEETPFFCSTPKMRKFVDVEPENMMNGFSIPVKVSKGERPIIPWTKDEEFKLWISEFMEPYERNRGSCCKVSLKYIELMKECWNQDPKQRPNFNQIETQLFELAKEVKG